jgi:uncharacterized membrane protein
MGKSRLEAFSDGVFAIIITIMVLELKVPAGDQLSDLTAVIPLFLSYTLSFVYVGIYWGNHHHLLHLLKHVNAGVIWANLHVLFWLSLVPFVTGWLGAHAQSPTPTFLYGVVMLMSGTAYDILVRSIRSANGTSVLLPNTHPYLHKGNISLALYALATLISCWYPLAAQIIFVLVALMWFIPDPRIENAVKTLESPNASHPDHHGN